MVVTTLSTSKAKIHQSGPISVRIMDRQSKQAKLFYQSGTNLLTEISRRLMRGTLQGKDTYGQNMTCTKININSSNYKNCSTGEKVEILLHFYFSVYWPSEIPDSRGRMNSSWLRRSWSKVI